MRVDQQSVDPFRSVPRQAVFENGKMAAGAGYPVLANIMVMVSLAWSGGREYLVALPGPLAGYFSTYPCQCPYYGASLFGRGRGTYH
jgi:hypothetical protein